MASCCNITVLLKRNVSTTAICSGKRNFRKFMLHNKRGPVAFKKKQMENPDPDVPIYHYGVRPIGMKRDNTFSAIPEMIPEIIVPDLTDFKLKPYVSYRVSDVVQSEFTAKDLFDCVYRGKITEDFKNSKLDLAGNPKEPSPEEAMGPEEAFNRARKVGNDLF